MLSLSYMLHFILTALILLWALFCSPLWALDLQELSGPKHFQLVMIETVSTTRKTFLTATGRNEGIVEGSEASFNTENIAIVARAKVVTRDYTVWEVVETNAEIPFRKKQIVTMNRATENIWELIPKQKKEVEYLQNWVLRGSLGRGIHESISESQVQDTLRNEVQGDALYEYRFTESFSYAAGIRLEQESTEQEHVTSLSRRSYLIGELTYHFPTIERFYDMHFFTGLAFGVGWSQTEVDGLEQVGPAYLIPGVKVGLEHQLSKRSSFIFELGLESIVLREAVDFMGEQSTNQITAKSSFGYKYYF